MLFFINKFGLVDYLEEKKKKKESLVFFYIIYKDKFYLKMKNKINLESSIGLERWFRGYR